MTMQVTVHEDLAFLVLLLDKLFGVVDGGVEEFGWIFPPPVQVTASQGATIIPVNHPIWIEHWDHFEYEVLAKEFRFRVYRIR